jgi:hypothetical protein
MGRIFIVHWNDKVILGADPRKIGTEYKYRSSDLWA